MSTSEPAPPSPSVEKSATAIPPVGAVVTEHNLLSVVVTVAALVAWLGLTIGGAVWAAHLGHAATCGAS